MHYDMPPHAIWAVRGGSSKISSGDKHSYRMTAVLSVRTIGEKLPLLFLFLQPQIAQVALKRRHDPDIKWLNNTCGIRRDSSNDAATFFASDLEAFLADVRVEVVAQQNRRLADLGLQQLPQLAATVLVVMRTCAV
ncbi:hypothetical protein H257_11400 [Aphanomyces astaci]|uniref:Uncharacterized protein n=1 Tax=Aphanomyces astaci TaxID=112090 RepID=W4G5A7_APHAT|nr:hypothetical protein H257_11400 [Aphanomyces astaci]ETV74098.1 hypothetical protein H257_11400 [Aphanomyces astaci]|eukprot:XP_009836611.1 hypothetical protein H257_11400 [Aphanomyces astaci]